MRRVKILQDNIITLEIPNHYLDVKNILKVKINKPSDFDFSEYVKLEKLSINESYATVKPREIQFIKIAENCDAFARTNKTLLEMAQIVQCPDTLQLDKYRVDNFYYKYSLQNCKYFPKNNRYMTFLKCLMVKKIIVPKYIKFEILIMVIRQNKPMVSRFSYNGSLSLSRLGALHLLINDGKKDIMFNY